MTSQLHVGQDITGAMGDRRSLCQVALMIDQSIIHETFIDYSVAFQAMCQNEDDLTARTVTNS